MIQQIAAVQVPPSAQQQPAQTQKPDQSFESVLKQSTGRLVRKVDDKPAKEGQPSGNTEKKAGHVFAAADAAAPGAFPAAAMFQQVQSVLPVPAQTAGKKEVSAVSAPSVQALASTPSVQDMRTAAPLLSSPDASGKAVGSMPTVQQRVGPFTGQTGVPSNGQSAVPAKEQAGALPPNRVTVPSAANDLTPAVVPATAQQTAATPSAAAQAAVPLTPDAAAQPKQNAQPVQQAADGAQPAAQPIVPQPAAAQTSSGNSQSEAETDAQQATSQGIKQEKGSDETVYAGPGTSSFPELMQTGNVIIKISDAASDTAKSVSRQIADQVTMQVKAGNPQFEMELNPKELGKVTVKIAMQDGALTVEIAAANPKTQSMLLSNSGDIRSMLESTVNHPVQVLQASQDAQPYQQNQDSSNARQQEQQQHPHFVNQADRDDSEDSPDDFLTVIQQLRVKASMA